MPKPSSSRSNPPSRKPSGKQYGTYLSNSAGTRAGTAGAITTASLQTGAHKNDGFGVFAYYTGTKGYGDYITYGGTEATEAANFMFNQQILWNNLLDDSYITKWTYSPIKYWPNEAQGFTYRYVWTTYTESTPATYTSLSGNPNARNNGNGYPGSLGDYYKNIDASDLYYKLTDIQVIANTGVDDQDNDQNNNNAYTDYENGGNVSFFAYAPYVTLSASDLESANGGITKVNGQTTLAAANAVAGDPILTYVIPADASKVVDLLWGTKGNTSPNVKNTDGGVTSTATTVTTGPITPATTYPLSILKDYSTNADLSKQKTTGTIDFLFKHATSKVGGATTTTTTPADPSSVKNGLMVVLDLDDMKGAEVGGAKEDATKVTVKEIKIEARTLVENASKKPGEDGYTATYLKTAQGDFNLATGKWAVLTEDNTDNTQGNAASTTYIIDEDGSGPNVAGQLNTAIAEPASAPDKTADGFDGLPAGVLTTAQNVYQNEAEPLVFIPGTYPELTVTVDYLVRTKDANLANAYSEVEQKITKKLTFTSPVELNKQYSLLIHLGLTSVKFTASVSDWDVYSDGSNNFDSDGDGVDDIKVEDVWTPRNVGGMIVAYPATAASDATTLPVSTVPYYYINDKKTDINSDIAFADGYPTPTPTWISSVTASTGKLTFSAANIDYSSRTATIQLKYTKDGVIIYSEPIEITQLGRIPTSVDPNWDTDPALATANAAGGGDVSYTVTDSKVKVSGKESDNSTNFTNEEVTIDISDDAKAAATFIFIDKATGNKATWITVEDDKFVVAPNPSTASRQADLYVLVKGKLVPVTTNGTLTQNGKIA